MLVILKIGLVWQSVATTVERKRSEAVILMDVVVVVAVAVVVSDGQTQKPKVFQMLP